MQKFSDYLRHIRLIYVYFEKFTRHDGTRALGITYGISSPFKLPDGMNIEDACKVVSYLSEKVEAENNLIPASENSVAMVSNILKDYGFSKIEGYPHGHCHMVQEYSYGSKLVGQKASINGVVDLFSVGGDFGLFKKSDLYDRYFNWFTESVTKEEINEIYKNISIDINNLKSL
ncbi:MAG: hypothetical protein J6Q15_03035 [Clostridia bacterium]|nr:hypothetical protein [Clostridia bacterium]